MGVGGGGAAEAAGGGVLERLGLSGGASSSQSRRSFSFTLRATHPSWLPALRPGGRRSWATGVPEKLSGVHPHPRSPPAPTQIPGSGSRIHYLPGAPGPLVTAPPLGAPCVGPAPRDANSGCPRPAKPPRSPCGEGGEGKRGKWKRGLGHRELKIK